MFEKTKSFLELNYGQPGLFLLARSARASSQENDESIDPSPLASWLRDQTKEYVGEHSGFSVFHAFRFQSGAAPALDAFRSTFPDEPASCWIDVSSAFGGGTVEPGEANGSHFVSAQIEEVVEKALSMAGDLSQISASPGTIWTWPEKSVLAAPMTAMELISHLERFARTDVSDIHLRPGKTPFIRAGGGDIQDICKPGKHMTEDEILAFVLEMSKGKPAHQAIRKIMAKEDDAIPLFPAEGCNFACDIRNDSGEVIGRYRFNVFFSDTGDRNVRGLSAAIRRIPLTPKGPTDLGFPPPAELLLRQILQRHVEQGLILIAGPTGTGKSTTLAAFIESINRSLPLHIMTIEDPIEYRYQEEMSRITQIEVNTDVASYEAGLNNLLRQDPDIIVLGEIRSPAVAMLALSAAKTGHLVFATMHAATTAIGALRKLMEYASEFNDKDLSICAHTIRAIIAQKLVSPRQNADRADRLLAMEIIRPMDIDEFNELITDGAPPDRFYPLLREGSDKRNALLVQTMEKALSDLVAKRLIDDVYAAGLANDPAYYRTLAKQRETITGPLPTVNH